MLEADGSTHEEHRHDHNPRDHEDDGESPWLDLRDNGVSRRHVAGGTQAATDEGVSRLAVQCGCHGEERDSLRMKERKKLMKRSRIEARWRKE